MKKTILIVDDMKMNIDILTSILHPEYTIMAAISGDKAIRLMKQKQPDLVLLDIFMPGTDGFGVLQFMKENEELSNIPAIFVTGEHDEIIEEKGLQLGAVDYIKKPFNASIVGVKVSNHLELKSYRDNLKQLVMERAKQLEMRTSQLAASREAIIMGMSLMSESHDKITGAHIERIKTFTHILCDKLQKTHLGLLSCEQVNMISLFSPLHDVGKVGIPDNILHKTGFLTPEEFEIMKMHTLDGAQLLRKTETFLTDGQSIRDLGVAIEIAECHHERYDGKGYPYGLKGDDIPMSACIVALADVYDALRSPRPYKRAFSHDEALDIIFSENKEDMQHFHPLVLEVFNSVHEEFADIYC